jgi:hypothetical protein
MMFGGAQSPIMKKNKIILGVLHSFIVFPLMGSTLAMNPILSIGAQIGNISGATIEQEQISPEQQARLDQAAKIDAFFAERDMPVAGHGMKFVEVAEKNGLDPFLLPAIAARESSGYRDACNKFPTNGFGWHSCKVGFKTIDEAIEIVGKNLGGNNPNTAHHYEGKSSAEILNAYNPPSIVQNYTKQVLFIMKKMSNQEIPANTVASDTSTVSEG